MTPEQLRMSILYAAFQGKLVEQRTEEGTADNLYKQCLSDVSTAIKFGRIKKQKSLSEITDDDIVFDIPSSWKNIKLGEVSQLIDGEKVKGKEYKYLEVKYLRGNIEPKTVTEGKFAKQGQLVILVDGENSGEVFTLPEDGYLGSTFKVLYIVDTIDVEYVLKFFELKRSELRANKKGAAIPHLNKDLLFNYVIPLPPLEEQHRIIAKIEELLPYVDRYAEAYEKLEKFNAKFPEDMKKSILQYAIQGKLVGQRPEDGNAEDLYQQIQEEKQKLIKEGKIKKDKPLAEMTDDEMPFDIPDTWKWVRLSDVIDVRDGTHDTPGYIPEGYPLITGKDFYNGYFDFAKTKYISKEDYEEIIKRSKVDVDDILFSMIGGNIGSMIVITEENYIDMAIKNVALFKQYNYELSLVGYLEVFLRSQVPNMQAIAKGGAQSFVSLNMLRNYPFPLPPMAEQKRIVSRIKEILPICERLVQ